MCRTQITLICHKWSEHKGEHTLGDLTSYVTALTPVKHGWKVRAGDGEDKEWVEEPSEEWKGEMGCCWWGGSGDRGHSNNDVAS